MKVFTLYVGTSHPHARETLLAILRNRFESFTVISGEGYFRGVPEPMWFVRLGTDESEKVFAIAEEIRSALHQDALGIEYQSHYYRCTENDSASDLKILLGLKSTPRKSY
jgi:hypothetical protein